MLLAVALVQAPGAGPPITPPPTERVLAGAFVLKTEQFLRWQPVYNLRTGWDVALRPVFLVELSPLRPRALQGLALALESTPASGVPFELGIVRPRLQYQPPDSRTKVGVELPIAAGYSPGLSGGWQVFRPRLFVSGRF